MAYRNSGSSRYRNAGGFRNGGGNHDRQPVSIKADWFKTNHTHTLAQKASSVHRSYDEAGQLGQIEGVTFRYNKRVKQAEINVLLSEKDDEDNGRIEVWRFVKNPNFGKTTDGYDRPDNRDQIWCFIGATEIDGLSEDDEDPTILAKTEKAAKQAVA